MGLAREKKTWACYFFIFADIDSYNQDIQDSMRTCVCDNFTKLSFSVLHVVYLKSVKGGKGRSELKSKGIYFQNDYHT